MNALPSSRTPLRPVPLRQTSSPVRRSNRLTHRQKQRQSYQTIALEAGVKLTVNVMLGMAAIAALVKLVPYNVAQQTKVKELTVQVDQVEHRVAQLKADFAYHFDPQQTRRIMGEQSGLQDPTQLRVIFPSSSPE